MQDVQLALDARPPIDSKVLSDLCKGSLRSYLHCHDGSGGNLEFAALWQAVVASALGLNPSEKYLTAVCNCISVFLSSSASAPHDKLKQFSFSSRVWFQGYDCAWKAFDSGKTKPALQVLETLARLLQENPHKEVASSILREATQRLFGVLFTDSTSRQVKTACIALTCFIKKTGLLRNLEDWLDNSLDEVSSSWHQHQLHNGISLGNDPDSSSSARHLFLALLSAIRHLEARSAALKLFSLLLHAEVWTKDCRPMQQAAKVIELFVQSDAIPPGDFADNILPVVLDDKPCYQLFQDLYKPESDTTDSKLVLYLSVLRTGRLKNFLSEDGTYGFRGATESMLTPTSSQSCPLFSIRHYSILRTTYNGHSMPTVRFVYSSRLAIRPYGFRRSIS
jgi:hypothetical protein